MRIFSKLPCLRNVLKLFCYLSFMCSVAVSNITLVVAKDGGDDNKEGKVKESNIPPSASGPIRKSLILKPYLLLGYNVPELFTHPNSAPDAFFTDLTKFQNWRVGAGLRITSFFGIEVAYNSIVRNYQYNGDVNGSRFNGQVLMDGKLVYVAANFYSPALDVKFGTLEFTASVGLAGMFGLDHASAKFDITTSSGPQFMAGVGIIFGLPKFISIKGFTEVITFNDTPFDIPASLNSGIVINIYLL